MTRCKVLLSVAFLCTYSWLSNTALAQDIIVGGDMNPIYIQEPPSIITQPPDVLAPADEIILLPDTVEPVQYSPENPFKDSEYTDLANVAEAIIANGGNIDDYFYSEGFSTGQDGQLGNEYVCIRDDANRVYIGRSDICTNRKESDYSYIFIDQIDLGNFSLSSQQSPLYDPEQIYQTDDMIGNTSQYWDGCYLIDQGWSGTSGGSCPTINDQYDGQINFGYVNRTLTNTAAIDQALKGAGLETTGYTYSWRVKNADANWTTTGNGRAQADPFEVTVKIYDENGNSVYEKSYDYSYWMDWTSFSGSEEFDEPFNLDEISELQLSVTGYDIGYWAGYYGPEFADPSIKLNYRVAQEEDTTVEDLLFDQMCTNDPMYDISCPGYNDAMLAQITTSSSTSDPVEEIASVSPTQTGSDDGSNTGTETVFQSEPQQNTGVQEKTQSQQIAASTDSSSTGIESSSFSEQPESAPDAEETQSQQIVAQEETETETDSVEEEMTKEAASSEEKKSTGLNANQLAALDIAENATSAAQSTAATASQQSAGIGLSSSGGVSSQLTSDGISNANGTLSSNVASIVSGSDSSSSNSSINQSTGSNGQTGSSFGDNSGEQSNSQSNLNSGFAANSINQSGGSSIGGEFSLENSLTGVTGGGSNIQSSNTNTQSNIQISSSNIQNNNLSINNNIGQNDMSMELMDTNGLDLSTEIDTNSDTGSQDNTFEMAALDIDNLSQLDINNPIIDDIINGVTNNLIESAVKAAEEIVEESLETAEEQNAKEDELVEKALSGDDSEDAQAALLGYNPEFRAYQTPQLPDNQFYQPKDIYDTQENYDNPNQRFFNGASDATHREMVRQQYER